MKRLKPKTARRLLLLSIILVMTATAVVGLVFVRKWQDHRRSDRLRVAGMDYFQQGDYPQVLDNLGRYLRRRPQDREAWLAYAKSRELVEESTGSQFLQAMNAYQKALALDDSDRPTALKLLTIYNQVGYYTEAKDLALKLRPASLADATQTDAPVLAAEAAALFGLKNFDERLGGVTARLVALDPSGYRPAAMRINWLLETNHKDEATAFVSSLAADDVRFRVLREIVKQSTSGAKETAPIVTALCAAAALDESSSKRLALPTYTDTEFAEQVVSMFDGFRMFSHSMAVLRDAADRLGNADFKRLYVRRLWQSGLMQDLGEYLANADQGPRGAHSEILAFRYLALRESGHPEDAKSALTALRARDRDFYAQAWASALSGMFEEQEPRAALALVESAIKTHPREPVFAFMKGECLARLGRAEEARAAWKSLYASSLSTGWALPLIQTSQTLLDEGRLDEAVRAAAEAQANNPTSVAAAVAVVRAQAAILESGRLIPNPERILVRVNEMKATFDKLDDHAASQILIDTVLPAEAALLAATGKPEEAKGLIRKALHASPPPSADMIRRLAAASARANLGLEDECFAANSESSGAAPPQLTLARALYLNEAGKRDEGLSLIQKGLAAATPPDDVPWRLARAQFFDMSADPAALDVWRDLTETVRTSLPVQLAALRSSVAVSDLAYVERLIKRVVALGGSDPDHPSIDVRLARARALLNAPLSAQTRDEAVSILRGLIVEAPAVIQVRDSLIAALLLDDPAKGVRADVPGAIEQLRAAAASPEGASYTIRLAQLLIRQGRPSEAASELSKLALNKVALPNQRLAAIDMLIAQRELEKARTSLESMLSENTAEGATDVLLRQANVLALFRRDTEALGVLRELARRRVDDPDTVASVAISLQALGAQTDANRLIESLSVDDAPNKQRMFALARFAERAGDTDQTARQYAAATEAFPNDPEVWVHLGRFRMARSEFQTAVETARKGLVPCPDNPDLLVLLAQATMAQSTDPQVDLLPLADAFAKSPKTARRAEALRALQAARADGKFADPPSLADIAGRFQEDPATQAFVIRQLLTLGPTGNDRATIIARTALTRFPSDVELAQLATAAFSARGEWESMLEAAEAWRQLSRAPSADASAAEAQLALNRPRQAADLVRPYTLPPILRRGASLDLDVLNIRTRSSVILGDMAVALDLIQRYIAESAAARIQIALPVAASVVPNETDARNWIEIVAAKCDPSSVEEQLAITQAWATASNRFPQAKSDFLKRAVAVTDKLISSESTTSGDVFRARAGLFDALDDKAAALSAYREAIVKDPKSAPGLLSFARFLLATNADPVETVAIARRAADAAPSAPGPLATLANGLVTLSAARGRSGDAQGRDAARREAQDTLKSLQTLVVNDPTTLFEIANLGDRLDDLPSVINAYERILASPRAPAGKTLAVVKNNLAFALFSQPRVDPSIATLHRAKALALEAVQLAELAPFYETLGSIEAALNDRAGAIAAYQKAISIDPNSLAASVGLAELLSGGSAEERSGAARFIRDVEAGIAAGGDLSSFRRTQLQRAKENLTAR